MADGPIYTGILEVPNVLIESLIEDAEIFQLSPKGNKTFLEDWQFSHKTNSGLWVSILDIPVSALPAPVIHDLDASVMTELCLADFRSLLNRHRTEGGSMGFIHLFRDHSIVLYIWSVIFPLLAVPDSYYKGSVPDKLMHATVTKTGAMWAGLYAFWAGMLVFSRGHVAFVEQAASWMIHMAETVGRMVYQKAWWLQRHRS